MFNIGAGEMILIALVLLIAVGPEQLPGLIRRTGRVVGQLKTMSDNLRRDFNASLDEIERAADVKGWAGAELESTAEAVKDAATEPFKTDLGVDGSTKVTDMWSRPAAADDPVDGNAEEATVDAPDPRGAERIDVHDVADEAGGSDGADAAHDAGDGAGEPDDEAEPLDTGATDEVA